MEAVAPSPELTSIEPPDSSDALVPSREQQTIEQLDQKGINAKGKRGIGSLLLHYAMLLGITALGGSLRFLSLDHPSIWGDEAATFNRVCGTFRELMDRLQTAGFAPVHYELYWWIGQQTLLTPLMMRLVPAICGTLMIPAMYWLAAQLIGRRPALLTALITATSAYLLNYSRDAKMYSPFWLFAAINVASLLWWLRVRTPVSWCAWIASGTAMVGFDALGWITIAIELLIILTSRRANWLSLPRLGLLLFCSVIDWSLTVGVPVFAVLLAAHGLNGPLKIVAITVIALAVLRILWLAIDFWRRRRGAGERYLPTERSFVRPWLIDRVAAFGWPPIALFVLGILIMLAGPLGYYYDFNRFLERVDERGWNGTGIEWVQRYNEGRSGPSLVEYTATAYLTSWEWPRMGDFSAIAPRTLRLLTASTFSLAAVLAIGLLPIPGARKLNPLPPIGGWRCGLWLSLWLAAPPYAFYCISMKDHVGPRTWLTVSLDFLHQSPWVAAILVVMGMAWFLVSGSSWRERLVRTFQFLAIVLVTLAAIECIYALYPIIDAKFGEHSEGWREHTSVWMPRYIAVILPAFLIIITALLWRLPTRPLRWGGISLLVIVNLALFGCRVFAGSEPPSGLIAQDLLDSQKAEEGDGSMRAYFQSSMQAFGAGPGEVSVRSDVIRYYMVILSPRSTPASGPPNQMTDAEFRYRVRPGRMIWMTFTGYLINEVRRSPKMQRFVTWEKLDPRDVDLTDKPLDALAPDWKLAGEQTFSVRDHWRWMDYCVLRRRVYVRTASGAH